MKVLTLTQPWATLVALGEKRVETRSWKTAYRGPLAIHAAATYPKWARELAGTEPFRTVLAKHGYHYADSTKRLFNSLPFGQIICVCRLVSIAPTTDLAHEWVKPLSPQEQAFGDYGPWRFAWFLDNICKLDTPMPAKGALGLWDVADNAIRVPPCAR